MHHCRCMFDDNKYDCKADNKYNHSADKSDNSWTFFSYFKRTDILVPIFFYKRISCLFFCRRFLGSSFGFYCKLDCCKNI